MVEEKIAFPALSWVVMKREMDRRGSSGTEEVEYEDDIFLVAVKDLLKDLMATMRFKEKVVRIRQSS